MTRTVADLLEALEPARPAETEPVAFLRETIRRSAARRARRRMLASAAGAVAAVVVLAGLPAALGHWAGPTDGAAAPSSAQLATSPAPNPTSARSRPVLSQTLRASTVTPWVISPYTTADEF